jgi:hypothetical protein
MKASQAPAFLKRAIPLRSALKTARKRAKARPERFAGDTGTSEIKLRQKVLIEARQRSLKGEPSSAPASKSSFPMTAIASATSSIPTTPGAMTGYGKRPNASARISTPSGLARKCAPLLCRVSRETAELSAPAQAIAY